MSRTRWAVVLLAAVSLGLTACAPGGGGGGGGGGDSKGPIKIGVLADLTGATGDVGTPGSTGTAIYVARSGTMEPLETGVTPEPTG